MKLAKINETQITELLMQTRQKSWCCGSATLKLQRRKRTVEVKIDTVSTKYGRKQYIYVDSTPMRTNHNLKKDILNTFDNKYVRFSLNA